MFIPFTEEQKQRANAVDLADFLRQRGERLLPSGRDKRLASNHSVTVRGNRWFDHATGEGGGAVSFARQFYGLSFPEAVTLLLGGEQGVSYIPAAQAPEPEKEPFALPPAHTNMRRVFAYLCKRRCIDREIVAWFAHEKLLYESCEPSKDKTKEYHNAVFVGKDEHGVARHGHKHGLFTMGANFKGNLASSDPRYSFHYVGGSDRLYVFEAPIDMLSYLTLSNGDWTRDSYVSLCGTSEHALLWMLEQQSQLQSVSLCLDSDEAGVKATERLTRILAEHGYTGSETLTPELKDWNDVLVSQSNTPNYEMKME